VFKNFSNQFDVNLFDRINLNGEIHKHKFSNNFNFFNFSDYLIQNKIYFSVDNISNFKIVKNYNLPFLLKIKKNIFKNFSNNIIDNFILGILFGDKSFIDKSIIENFKIIGISHILAISGLHIGFITTFLYFIFKKLKLNKITSFILLSIILLSYLFILDWTASAFRAVLMSLLILFAIIIQRRIIPLNILSVAFIIIIFFKSDEIFNPGFQLSFAAVFSIFYLFLPIYNLFLNKNFFIKYLISPFILSFFILIITAPITIHHFNFLSLHSLWANIIIVPLMGLIIPLSLIYVLSFTLPDFFTIFFRILLEFLINLIYKFSYFLAGFKIFTFSIPSFNLLFYLFYYFLILLIFKFQKKYIKIYAAIFLIFCIIFFISIFIKSSTITINFPDNNDNEFFFIKFYTTDFLIINNISDIENFAIFINEHFMKNNIKKILIISNDEKSNEILKKFLKEPIFITNELSLTNVETKIEFKKINNKFLNYLKTDLFDFLSFPDIQINLQQEYIQAKKFNGIYFYKLINNGSLLFNSLEIISLLKPKYLIAQSSINNKYDLPAKELYKNYNENNLLFTKKNGGIKIIYIKIFNISKKFIQTKK